MDRQEILQRRLQAAGLILFFILVFVVSTYFFFVRPYITRAVETEDEVHRVTDFGFVTSADILMAEDEVCVLLLVTELATDKTDVILYEVKGEDPLGVVWSVSGVQDADALPWDIEVGEPALFFGIFTGDIEQSVFTLDILSVNIRPGTEPEVVEVVDVEEPDEVINEEVVEDEPEDLGDEEQDTVDTDGENSDEFADEYGENADEDLFDEESDNETHFDEPDDVDGFVENADGDFDYVDA